MATSFLKNVLVPERIRLSLAADSKVGVITELIDILAADGALPDRADAEAVVLAREQVMSTGMENGVAIPHGKTNSVDQLLVSMALKPEGMDFACADGLPGRIFFLTLSPLQRSGPHLRFMAEIARLLRSASLREQLLRAESPEQVVKLLVQ